MRLYACAALALLLVPTAAYAQPAPAQPAPTQPVDDGWNHPAKAADPPLIPPPPAQLEQPLSTSGTDIAPAPSSASGGDAGTESTQEKRLEQLEQRANVAEERLRYLERENNRWKNLTVSAYVQPQLLVQSYNDAASPNLQANGQLPPGIHANDITAKADGTTTNGTYFKVRRARLRTIYETRIMRLFLQLDAFPAGGVGPGIGTILRNAEATGIMRWHKQVRTEVTAGIFLTPFRRELVEISMVRPFIERTWFVQNVFPLERNYGIHANTIALDDTLSVDLAVVNGQTLGERTFTSLPDLNRAKDFIARATYRLAFATVGASGYLGKGQIVDTTLLRFKQFEKSALGFEGSIANKFLPRLGESRLYSELTFGANMDSGVNYAFATPKIPVVFDRNVDNIRERAFYVRFEQDVGKYALLGYRYDTYTPNVSIKNNARDTHAFLAVAKISPNLRFMNELAFAIDNAHAFGAPPPSKHIVTYSGVLQAQF